MNKILKYGFPFFIVVLFLFPFLFMGYCRLFMLQNGVELRTVIQSSPAWNLQFIIAFLMPFFGFFLSKQRNNYIENRKLITSIYNMYCVAISFLLLQNYTLAIMLLFLIHIIVIKNSIGYINIYKNITEINFKEISLGIFFIIISLILSLLVIRIS